MAQSTDIFKELVNALTDKEWGGKPNHINGLRVVLYGFWGEGKKEIAMRYLSPKYYKTYKPNKNDESKRNFESEGVEFIDFPFYLAFSEDVIKHCFFKTLFNESKKINESEKINENEKSLKNAIENKCYQKISRKHYEEHVKEPGWYNSPHRIHTFSPDGLNRFKKELDSFPSKISKKIVDSIKEDYLKNYELEKKYREQYPDFNETMNKIANKYN